MIIYNGNKDATLDTLDFLKDKDNGGINVYISLLDDYKCFAGHLSFCDSEISKLSLKCEEEKNKLIKARVADQDICNDARQKCIDDSYAAKKDCD